MMNWKRNFVIITLGILFVFSLVACQNQEAAQEAETTTDATAVSPVSETNSRAVSVGVDTVSAEGEIVPLRTADLSFQMGGTVQEIIAVSGQDVQAGDPLIRLEAAALENAVKQAEAGKSAADAGLAAAQAQLAVAQSGINRAQAGVTAAEARMALVKAGARDAEIAAAEDNLAAAEGLITQAAGNSAATVNVSDAKVRAAEAQLVAAQADAQALEEGYQDILDACFELPDGSEVCPLYGPVEESTRAQLAVAKAQVSAAQAAVDEARAGATPGQQYLAGTGITLAQAQRDQAQAQLDLLLAGARDEQVRQAEVGVTQAQLGVDQAGVQVTQAQSAVTQAEAAVQTANANLEAAQKALARMTLVAPFAGRVGDINAEVGELLAPGVPVLRFADFDRWLVKTTDLTELDVVTVKNGSTAQVTIDALPGELINGEVIDIASVSQLTRGDVTYEVTIALDETELPLRWGMTAFVDVDAE